MREGKSFSPSTLWGTSISIDPDPEGSRSRRQSKAKTALDDEERSGTAPGGEERVGRVGGQEWRHWFVLVIVLVMFFGL